MPDIVSLEQGTLRLDVFPKGGGAITRFAKRTAAGAWIELLRPAPDAALETREPLSMSCFPLVPYCDLVTGNAFTFAGERYTLAPNHPKHEEAIHGEGWVNPWTIEQQDRTSLQLALTHRPDGQHFPFAYNARQRFTLTEDRLEVTIDVLNKDDRPMPTGIGIHPYYQRTDDLRVRADAPMVWPSEAARLRAPAIPVPEAWDFRTMRGFGEVDLDHSFAGWNGRYDIEWPTRGIGLTVTADPVFRNLLIFVPKHGDHFCMEPISNAMDAFNLASLGLSDHNVSIVQPGHRLVGRVVFRPYVVTTG